MTPRRLLIAAAGSGGHIYPGLSVARAFAALGPAEVRFVGMPGGLTERLVAAHRFPLDLLSVPPLRGQSPGALLGASFRLARSYRRMRRLLREFRPQVVFGTGGSVSGVAVLAARASGIASLILEPNAEPGFANRWSARLATEVAVGWEAARCRFPRRVFVSGIPVRPGFFELAPPPGVVNGSMSVLITGGSQGASRINRMVIEALPALRERAPGLSFTHQTGPAEEDAVRAAYREHGVRGRVAAYLDDMPEAVEAADLVVGRAGALTCAEIAAAGRPAILVPAPVAGGHQRTNAALFAGAGAALTVEDGASGEEFAAMLAALVANPHRREHMARAAQGLAHGRPAERLAARLGKLAEPAR